MECKEIILDKRKCKIEYVKDKEELNSNIEKGSPIIEVSYFSNDYERISEEQLFSILEEKSPELFFTSADLLGNNVYEDLDLAYGYTSQSVGVYCEHVQLSFSIKR